MKLLVIIWVRTWCMSLPVRGAWIEISASLLLNKKSASLPVRGAWIEMSDAYGRANNPASLPVRGAWIEMVVL